MYKYCIGSEKMVAIIRKPKTVKALASEIINICDGYWKREIPEDEVKKYISYWSVYENNKLFKGTKINTTIGKIIGKKRMELVSKMQKETKLEQ